MVGVAVALVEPRRRPTAAAVAATRMSTPPPARIAELVNGSSVPTVAINQMRGKRPRAVAAMNRGIGYREITAQHRAIQNGMGVSAAMTTVANGCTSNQVIKRRVNRADRTRSNRLASSTAPKTR